MPSDLPAVFEPIRVFDLVLRAMLADQGERTRAIDAVVEFVVDGPERTVWAVDFAAVPASVEFGESDEAELSLVLHSSRVAALLAGELDVEAASADGTLAVTGDTEVLARIAAVFAEQTSLTGMDLLYAGMRRSGG